VNEKAKFPDHHNFRIVVENSRTRGRFADYRCGIVRGWRCAERVQLAKGEENIKISGGHTIVEMMRKGMSRPTRAWKHCTEWRELQQRQKELATFHIYLCVE